MPVLDTVRLDKWLWAARFFKTRSAASQAIAGGKVDHNGQRGKPSRPVRIEDRIQIRKGAESFDVQVIALADRRGSADVAQTLYRETPESLEARAQLRDQAKLDRVNASSYFGKGRPTKRDRRRLLGLKRGGPTEES